MIIQPAINHIDPLTLQPVYGNWTTRCVDIVNTPSCIVELAMHDALDAANLSRNADDCAHIAQSHDKQALAQYYRALSGDWLAIKRLYLDTANRAQELI